MAALGTACPAPSSAGGSSSRSSRGELVITHRGAEIARHRLAGPGRAQPRRRPLWPASRSPGPGDPASDGSRARVLLAGTGGRGVPAGSGGARARPGSPTSSPASSNSEPHTAATPWSTALERALAFRRYGAADVRAILDAGVGTPVVRPPGARLTIELPAVPVRLARRLCPGEGTMTAAEIPPLAPDLEAGLRRLKLRAMRSLAPEVLQTAKVQRWAPDELLRTLVDAEITAREQAGEARRRRVAGFPVREERSRSSRSPRARSPRRRSTTSPRSSGSAASENLVLVGPPGTGKSHALIGLGRGGHPGRLAGPLLRRRGPCRDAVPRPRRQQRGPAHRGPAAGRPRHLRRARLRAARRRPAPSSCSGSWPRPMSAASLGIASHWPFEEWGRFLPEQTTAVALLDRLLHHSITVVTSGRFLPDEGGSNERRWATDDALIRPSRVGTFHGRRRGLLRWPLTVDDLLARRAARSNGPRVPPVGRRSWRGCRPHHDRQRLGGLGEGLTSSKRSARQSCCAVPVGRFARGTRVPSRCSASSTWRPSGVKNGAVASGRPPLIVEYEDGLLVRRRSSSSSRTDAELTCAVTAKLARPVARLAP